MKINVLQRIVEKQNVCVCDLVKPACQNCIWMM